MHDTNRIRNQIDSENETTLQIPLRGNAPGSRPLPDVRFLPRRHDGGDSESPAAPPRHRIRGTASAQRIHELHHPTERRERRPGGRTADGDIVYTATVELPEFWADRIIMLHCEGGRNSHRVSVNGTAVGSARDSGTPSEFELPNAVAGRTNTLRIELPADTDEPESGLRRQRADLTSCFLYSQPRTRIWDYDVSTVLTGSDGELTARVVVENRYPSEETFSLCFDVFSPEGRVEEYGTKRVTLPAGDRDTVTLRATIYGAGKKLWGAEKPALYRLTLFVRKEDRILEYVPVNVGFGTVSHAVKNQRKHRHAVQPHQVEIVADHEIAQGKHDAEYNRQILPVLITFVQIPGKASAAQCDL